MDIEPETTNEYNVDKVEVDTDELLLGAGIPSSIGCCEYIKLSYDDCDKDFCGIYELDPTKDKPTFVNMLDEHIILQPFDTSNVSQLLKDKYTNFL